MTMENREPIACGAPGIDVPTNFLELCDFVVKAATSTT